MSDLRITTAHSTYNELSLQCETRAFFPFFLKVTHLSPMTPILTSVFLSDISLKSNINFFKENIWQ
jgi:hypothetical protein